MKHTFTNKTTLFATALAIGLGSQQCSALSWRQWMGIGTVAGAIGPYLYLNRNAILFYGAQSNAPTLVRLALALGADVNATHNFGLTPLHEAAYKGHTAIVQALLAAGANVNYAEINQNKTPLHLAAGAGHTATVQTLLATPGINVNAPDCDGWTPLHYAAYLGHTTTVQTLLDAGANVNCAARTVLTLFDVHASGNYAVINQNKTPLHLATGAGYTATVQTLLDASANINGEDNSEWTPLHEAALFHRTEVAQLLIAHGATLPASSKYYEWYLEQCAPVLESIKRSTHQ